MNAVMHLGSPRLSPLTSKVDAERERLSRIIAEAPHE